MTGPIGLPFRRLARRLARMANDVHSDVQIGQCFQQNHVVWEVVDFKSLNNLPHVKIMKVGDPYECKLIALRALRDDFDPAPQ